MAEEHAPGIIVRHEGQTPRERSGCGWRDRLISREDRALAPAAWVHAVDIEGAQPHYHKRATELYYVLEGAGVVVLDGVEHEVRKGSLAQIPPGVVHGARGQMRLLVVGIPDIADEDYFPVQGGYPLKPPELLVEPGPDPTDDILYGFAQCEKLLSDKNASAHDHAAYLSWLMHLVGDIHMPLDCCSLFTDAYRICGRIFS